MPRILSAAMHREFNQLESATPLVWLFQVDIPGAGAPFRLANYPETILFHGLEFLPFGVDVDALEDASTQAIVHLRCTFQNVDQTMIALLENFWGPDSRWTVTNYQVTAAFPNEVALTDGALYAVGQIVTTWRDAVADLYAENMTLSATLPKRRFTSLAGFPFIPRRIGF